MTIDELNFSPLNLIMFPDWSQWEDSLYQDLRGILRGMLTHRERDYMSLFIDTSNLGHDASEEVNFLLSEIVMNLLLEEEFELSCEPDVILLSDLSQDEWSAILAKMHYRLGLTDENLASLSGLEVSNLPILDLAQLSADTRLLSVVSLRAFAWERYQLGDYLGAIKSYQKLLEFSSGDIESYLILSDSLRQVKRYEDTIALLFQAIKEYPNAGQLHFELIKILHQNGRTEEAISQGELASQVLPNEFVFRLLKHLTNPMIYHSPDEIAFYRERYVKELDKLIAETPLETVEDAIKVKTGLGSFTNFYLAYQAYNVVKPQSKYAHFVHEVMKKIYPQWVESRIMPPLGENGKIRVGYVSNFLHSYSGTLWLTGWLRYCNKEQFEVYSYYIGNEPDRVTEQFREYSDIFHHIPHNLEAVCQQIIEDKLHILVYPEIGMDATTILIASLRLAPVQCVAWGHPVTSGLPMIDYFLSSELMEPEDADEHYLETLIRLPNIGVAYPKPLVGNLTMTRVNYNLPDDAIIYLCCQAPFKYLPQYDYIFAEIARLVPNALFIFPRGDLLLPRLQKAFANLGLNSNNHCRVLPLPTRADYIAINYLSDIFLDTITWSGGNTTLEAIACHLPIVTYPGKFMRGLHAYSFLKMLGVDDTIAQDEKDYINIAVKLGLNSEWRNQIKEKMRDRVDNLFDDRLCVTGLEQFYQQVVTEKRDNKE